MCTALGAGITGRAQKNQRLSINYWNPRDFTKDKHHTVDNSPYGGGPGMVMMAEPIHTAILAAKNAAPQTPKVIYLSPQGRIFDQQAAEHLASLPSLVLLAGRYEGIDERVLETIVEEEWSIGNYVLSGGELAAMVMIDTITRLLPGVVGDENSVLTDSLTSGLLKYPQYTRPELTLDLPVPPVLLSGNHSQIQAWRLKMSLGQTWLKRKDLLKNRELSETESRLLAEFIEEWYKSGNCWKSD